MPAGLPVDAMHSGSLTMLLDCDFQHLSIIGKLQIVGV
jgi:hypothetical protein